MDFSRFLKYYNPYVNHEWRAHYFAYDTLRQRYKAIKEHGSSEEKRQQAVFTFEEDFLREIRRVFDFLAMIVHEIDTDLVILLNAIEKNNNTAASSNGINANINANMSIKSQETAGNASEKKLSKSEKKLREQHDRTIELSLRSLYDKCKDIELFYHLNYYSICKISKKLEKLLQLSHIVVEVQQQTAEEIQHHTGRPSVRVSVENISGRKYYPPSAVSGFGVVSVQGIQHPQHSPAMVVRKKPVSSSSSPPSPSGSARSNAQVLPLPFPAEEMSARSTVTAVEEQGGELKDKENQCGEEAQESETAKSSVSTTTLHHSSTALPAVQVVQTWESTPCGRFFFSSFQPMIDDIERLKQRCVDTYSRKFRITYSQLASYELEFVKNKDKHYESTNFFLGLKAGLIICLVLLLVLDTETIHNDFEFWQSPGLYVYTTVGNLLLYRVCWWVNIAVWAKFDVNYLSILQMNDVKPNLLLVADQTSTLLSLFFIDLLLYFRSNTSYSSLGNTFLSFSSPIVLIALAILYQFFEYFFLFNNERVSRGLFSIQVIKNCVSTPWVRVTFRDNYSADVLTSFTRIIADSLHAACWVFSGNFLGREKSADHAHCSNSGMVLAVSYVQMIPLLIRFLQCCRNVRDANFTMYPQAWNALKYFLSMVVVVSALQYPVLGEKNFSLMIVIVTALYKWYWDVVFDWGLFEIWPQSLSEIFYRVWNCVSVCVLPASVSRSRDGEKERKGHENTRPPSPASPQPEGYLFLRKSLMYPSPLFYYVSIVLDLALRFLWVLSLVPQVYFGSFVGYQLKLFLGSMEILRRCLWGTLRVEYEHLKMLKNKTPGFLQNRVLRRSSVGSFEGENRMVSGSADSRKESEVSQAEGTCQSSSSSPEVLATALMSGEEKEKETDMDTNVEHPLPSPDRHNKRRIEQQMARHYSVEKSDFIEKLKHFNSLHHQGGSGVLPTHIEVSDPIAALSFSPEHRESHSGKLLICTHDISQRLQPSQPEILEDFDESKLNV